VAGREEMARGIVFEALSEEGVSCWRSLLAGAVFGVATAVQASIPDASGVIHGCLQHQLGAREPDRGAAGSTARAM
jgi:hypothetical protein